MVNIKAYSSAQIIKIVGSLTSDAVIEISNDNYIEKLSDLNTAENHSIVWFSGSQKLKLPDSLIDCIVITSPEAGFGKVHLSGSTIIRVENPRLVAARLFAVLGKESLDVALDSVQINSSSVSETMADDLKKLNINIGREVWFGGNVRLYGGVSIGDGVKIGSNTVIGAQGFAFARDEGGQQFQFPHFGGVVIDKEVYIGANCCIDSGGLSPTTIGLRTKISNFCQISHNVTIGSDCQIAGCVQVGGGAHIGSNVQMGPNSVISNKLLIGNFSTVRLGSVVVKNIGNDGDVSGNFAKDHKITLRNYRKV
jgi:UDP-3-O-[3-hydroxymyristoyl] glucosamine N-acyltransferase